MWLEANLLLFFPKRRISILLMAALAIRRDAIRSASKNLGWTRLRLLSLRRLEQRRPKRCVEDRFPDNEPIHNKSHGCFFLSRFGYSQSGPTAVQAQANITPCWLWQAISLGRRICCRFFEQLELRPNGRGGPQPLVGTERRFDG